MAGVLMSYRSSYFFGNEWNDLLHSFGVSEYHATKFHGRCGPFAGWSDHQRHDFELAIVHLLVQWDVKHSGVAIIKDDYKRSFVNTGFHRRLVPATRKWRSPYLQAFHHIITDLRTYADHQPRGLLLAPIFDQCQEFIGQAKVDYDRINADRRLGQMIVSNTPKYVQLQVADFLAWEYRAGLERRLRTGDKCPNLIMQALMPHMFLAQFWPFDYLECLRKRVEAYIEGDDPDGVTLPNSPSSVAGS
jgi:hypothetical protein